MGGGSAPDPDWSPVWRAHGRVVRALAAVVPGLPEDAANRALTRPATCSATPDAAQFPLAELSCNAVLLACGPAGRTAMIASAVVDRLRDDPLISHAFATRPGFINLRLHPSAWLAVVPAVLDADWMPGPVPNGSPRADTGLALRWDASASPWQRRRPGSEEARMFAVHHAFARCRSVLRAAAASGMAGPPATQVPLDGLLPEPALDVLRAMSAWPRPPGSQPARCGPEVTQPTARSDAILFFLYELANGFDRLWHLEGHGAMLRFIDMSRPERTRAVLALVAAVQRVIRAAAAELGLQPVEEMR